MRQTITAVIERDAESGWLVASVVELPGCRTQAKDMTDLVANLQEAIQVYMAAWDEDEPLPEFIGIQRVQVGI